MILILIKMMMMMTMMNISFILRLTTIVRLIILDIGVIVRAEVSSRNNTSHTGFNPTIHDTLT